MKTEQIQGIFHKNPHCPDCVKDSPEMVLRWREKCATDNKTSVVITMPVVVKEHELWPEALWVLETLNEKFILFRGKGKWLARIWKDAGVSAEKDPLPRTRGYSYPFACGNKFQSKLRSLLSVSLFHWVDETGRVFGYTRPIFEPLGFEKTDRILVSTGQGNEGALIS